MTGNLKFETNSTKIYKNLHRKNSSDAATLETDGQPLSYPKTRKLVG